MFDMDMDLVVCNSQVFICYLFHISMKMQTWRSMPKAWSQVQQDNDTSTGLWLKSGPYKKIHSTLYPTCRK